MTMSEMREFAAIEHVDTRVVLPVEGGGAWGVGLCFVRRRIEPQAQVEGGQALAAVWLFTSSSTRSGPVCVLTPRIVVTAVTPRLLARGVLLPAKVSEPFWASRT